MSKTGTEDWWLALVTFERGEDHTDFLEETDQGAVGWMACRAGDIEVARLRIGEALREVGLRVVAIEREMMAHDVEHIAETDAHLAENVARLEAGKTVVWGTIHAYLAEGEG